MKIILRKTSFVDYFLIDTLFLYLCTRKISHNNLNKTDYGIRYRHD